MRFIFKFILLASTFNILMVFSVRTQTTDLHMIDIVPLNEPKLNENIRYRAVCTNNGPDSLPDSTEVNIIWTVKNRPINARYELAWAVNDTLRLLSPPYMFLSADSFQVCAEFDFPADSNSANHSVCITQVLEEPNFVWREKPEAENEIRNERGEFSVFGQNRQHTAAWKIFDTSGRLIQTRKGERFRPRVSHSGIYIIQARTDENVVVKKVFLHARN